MEVTDRCLSSLLKQSKNTSGVNIEIVDNNHINRGYFGGCVEGASRVLHNTEFLVFCNNDIVFSDSFFPTLDIYTNNNNNYNSILNCKVVDIDTREILYNGGFVTMSGVGFYNNAFNLLYHDTDIICGYCFIVSSKLYKNLVFNCSYFMYCEDLELSYKAKLDGIKMIVIDGLEILHKNHFKQFAITSRKFHTRNMYYIMPQIYGKWWKIYYFLYFVPIRIIFFLVKRKWKSAIAVFSGVIAALKNERGPR